MKDYCGFSFYLFDVQEVDLVSFAFASFHVLGRICSVWSCGVGWIKPRGMRL